MILKIELKEMFNNFEEFLIIDLIHKQVKLIKDDSIIKNEQVSIEVESLTDLVKKHITYWDNEYKEINVIDGTKIELNIYTVDEIVRYEFINKFPYNCNDFIKKLKELVISV